MKVISTQLYNQNYSANRKSYNSKNTTAPQFTGKYDQFTEWIANNYYKRFYNSKFAKSFINNTKGKKWNNMTTHMSALGSTLISGMYIVRTLQNDKLDVEKRKTLALNDLMVWALSTLGAYFMDAKLGNWWNGVTTRFTANYLMDNKKAKRVRTLGDWDPANINDMMNNWHEKVNARIDKINEAIKSPDYKGARKPLEKVEAAAYKNVRDFNLDVLKNRKLTTLIDGMGVLKSLFVFGMVYRYIVPVLVMKPANMIGNYYHKKQAEKAQAAQEAQQAK